MSEELGEGAMRAHAVPDPIDFVAALEGLHDVRIDRVVTDIDAETLVLEISTHFDGAPKYQGHEPIALIFEGLTNVLTDLDLTDGLRISNIEIVRVSDEHRLAIDLNIGGGPTTRGRCSILATFKSLSFQGK